MKCKACNHNLNSVTWYNILLNGKRLSIGNLTSRKTQIDIATAIYNGEYYYTESGDKISIRKYNHCFNCGGYKAELIFNKIRR